MALYREYTAAEYLTTVTDPKLWKAMYRLSEHSLAIERGHCRQTRLSREEAMSLPTKLGGN